MSKPARPKSYLGPTFRLLRERQGWSLQQGAKQLSLSASYLSQIEHNQRPVTAKVLIMASKVFAVPASEFKTDDVSRFIADLREASMDLAHEAPVPSLDELKLAASTTPQLVQQFLALHRHYKNLDERFKRLTDHSSQDTRATDSQTPYQEVRDFFHYRENYIETLDLLAESLATALRLGDPATTDSAAVLADYLRQQFAIRLETQPAAPESEHLQVQATSLMRCYDPAQKVLWLARDLSPPTRAFQLAVQVVELQFQEALKDVLVATTSLSPTAHSIARIALANYAAGALLMPYGEFLLAAQSLRHDIEQLQRRFGTSFEQTCHRLSTLQRPGLRGIPFYFVRVDLAGNITKRHSQTRFQFARFGGACPLWNVHESFSHPGRIMVQLAEMPDSVRYLCISRAIVKRSGNYRIANRQYAVGFGCETRYAKELVYSEGIDLQGQATPIGVNCTLCERSNCAQRAFPRLDRALQIMPRERRVVPYNQT
jgi:XRE family transcriptional regulator, fatty acid utilization regulator